MTWEDIVISSTISVVTGLISGLASGYIVSRYFKYKDLSERRFKEFITQKHKFLEYLQNLECEIDITVSTKQFEQIKRRLSEVPYVYMHEGDINRVHIENYNIIKSKLRELDNDIRNKNIDLLNYKYDINKLKANFSTATFKKYEP